MLGSMSRAAISLGVAGTLDPRIVGRIAPELERHGFHGLWVNDMPGGDSLAALHAAAEATTTLTLATGVIPVDRREPAEIIEAAAGLPPERTIIGIGSGSSPTGALARTSDAVKALREADAGWRVVVGALGPKMRELAARESAGIVLNWLPPAEAAAQAAQAHGIDAGTRVVLYVRTAVDEAGLPRLEKESDRYSALPNYAANFARLGITADDTVLRPDTISTRLDEYADAVDEVVLRAMTPGETVDDYLAFIERAAESL